MKCFYINLDAAEERRAALERNFAACKAPGWTLERFPATGVREVEALNLPGDRSNAEKACFLSHKRLMERAAQIAEPVLILEDDTVFGDLTCLLADQALSAIQSRDWDILWLDVGLTFLSDMVKLSNMKEKHQARGKLLILSLNTLQYFFGANAYIVNPKSIPKILAMFEAIESYDVAYDDYLQKQVASRAIAGFFVAPFATSVAIIGNKSQIQDRERNRINLLCNLQRKMLWIGPMSPEEIALIDKIQDKATRRQRSYGAIWGALAEGSFNT